jgi:hypothetical protein
MHARWIGPRERPWLLGPGRRDRGQQVTDCFEWGVRPQRLACCAEHSQRQSPGETRGRLDALIIVEASQTHRWRELDSPSVPGESGFDFAREVRGRLFAGGGRIRTFGSAMRLHRRQRGRGVTPPDPGGEWRLLGRRPHNSIGVPTPATARMTGAPVDRPQLRRTHETVAYLPRH